MNHTTLLTAFISLAANLVASAAPGISDAPFPYKLTKTLEVSGFENPESVAVEPASGNIYVSNINGAPTEKNGTGYISKLDATGTVLEKNWLGGLDAPKGLVLSNGKLYTTDIDKVVEIDLASKAVNNYQAEGATFLNDITADPGSGDIFITNSFGKSVVYRLAQGKLTKWLEGDELDGPNGIHVQDGKLWLATWGLNPDPDTFATKVPGGIITVDLETKAIARLNNEVGNLDGISQTLHGHFLTDWLDGALLYRDGKTGTVFRALDLPKGSADTFFRTTNKTVYIPLMLDGKLQGYQISIK